MTSAIPRTSLFSRRTFRQGAISAVGSVRIKLLLSCCIVFAIIAFASRAASIMGWKQSHTAYDLRPSSISRKGYALLINTWKRNDLLKQSISHYASCLGLSSIHIVWSEPDPPPASLIRFLNHVVQSNSRDGRQIEVKFDVNKEDSLNNRFKEIKDLKTDALFSIDDDVVFPCSSVELAFSIWQSAPDTMVGFVPRMHWVSKPAMLWNTNMEVGGLFGGWGHTAWFCLKRPFSTRSISVYLVTKCQHQFENTLLPTDVCIFLLPCSSDFSPKLTRSIGMTRNCEDIAMSFLVANATGIPPIWVKGKIFEIGSSGISSLGGHSDRRTQCVNKFVAEFGRMPLISTSVKVVDSRSNWFW